MQKDTLITVSGLKLNYNDMIYLGADKFVVTGKNEVKIARISVTKGLVWDKFPYNVLRLALENPSACWLVMPAEKV